MANAARLVVGLALLYGFWPLGLIWFAWWWLTSRGIYHRPRWMVPTVIGFWGLVGVAGLVSLAFR